MTPTTASAASNPILAAALAYAQRGWPVMPLNGKKPITENGSHDASTDPDIITQWWAKHPRANIGLATGIRFWVLDVDTKSGGDDSLESLELQHGKLPDTLTAITGTKGKHYLFAIPNTFAVRNSQGLIADGIDTRGAGGYIVAHPSIHPDTKRRYEWDGIEEWHDQTIQPAPEWLISLLREKQHTTTPSVIPTKIPKGKQHATLVSIAGSMRKRGLEFAEIFAALTVINRDRCTEPGPIENIEQIAHSICKYPAGKLPSDAIHFVTTSTAPTPDPSSTDPSSSIGNPDWQENLLRAAPSKKQASEGLPGNPLPCLANAIIAVEQAPEFADAIQLNELDQTIAISRDLPWRSSRDPWKDYDDTMLANWLQHHDIMVNPATAHAAAVAAAHNHPFHPIRDYLNALQWDQTPRINQWLPLYCNAQNDPYTRAVGEKWLIQAVARVFAPGCKADSCLILEGEQGIGKSTILATLGGDWFTDELPTMGSKDASIQVMGAWIIELAELDTLRRSEASAVKAFISRTTERFRLPYDRNVITAPRQCVFAGSVNHSEYLQDDTGNRRFWPVLVSGPLDIESLRRDRDQLWAEATHAFRAGTPWWLEAELLPSATASQNERIEIDPWEDKIEQFIAAREYTTISDILNHIGKDISQWTKADKNRVGSILRRAKWTRRRKMIGGVLAWYFIHPESEHNL